VVAYSSRRKNGEQRAVGEVIERTWPGAWGRDGHADTAVLEAVFESLGPDCVHRLVAAPHPFGLPPQDRRAAQRWLSRQTWPHRFKRDLSIVLSLVALGLAAALVVLSLYPAAPAGDGLRKSTVSMIAARD
jgi:hypothetical protein